MSRVQRDLYQYHYRVITLVFRNEEACMNTGADLVTNGKFWCEVSLLEGLYENVWQIHDIWHTLDETKKKERRKRLNIHCFPTRNLDEKQTIAIGKKHKCDISNSDIAKTNIAKVMHHLANLTLHFFFNCSSKVWCRENSFESWYLCLRLSIIFPMANHLISFLW